MELLILLSHYISTQNIEVSNKKNKLSKVHNIIEQASFLLMALIIKSIVAAIRFYLEILRYHKEESRNISRQW